MHIAEGVLSAPVLITGAVVAAAGVAYGLKKIQANHFMLAGLLGAAFFVASLIHVPNGFLGVVLGWAAFPVIFVALLLQAVLFQFGGFTVLGVNTATMGLGALAAYGIFYAIAGKSANKRLKLAGFCGGFSAVLISGILTALALAFTNEGFVTAASLIFLSNLPVMVVEGVITAFAVVYLKHSDPGIFNEK